MGNRGIGGLLETSTGDPGQPLDLRARLLMEAAYGQRFDAVRIHVGTHANEAAEALSASAFTLGRDIYFRIGRYSPRTPAGLRLLGHELAHVVQQGSAKSTSTPFADQVRSEPHLEREAHAAADSVGTGRPTTIAGAAAPSAVQCSPESDLISGSTSFGNLDEEALGKELLKRALLSEHDFVERVLGQLGTTDRDDVSYELVKAASDKDLSVLRATASGKRLLSRLYDEITSGKPDAEELQQAERVLKEKTQAVQSSDVEKGIVNAKIFPYRLPGLTVLNDAPISAQRRPKGRVWVKMPVRVLGTSAFRKETKTLPTEVFVGGLELPEDEIIGVKMYDLGGEVHYRPALYLVQLANETTTTTFEKIGETAGYGLSLGTMGAAAAGGTRLAQALMWADRVALGVGAVTSILREHRGWIIEKFGDEGREFLRYVDIVNSVAMFYGGIRALVGMGQVLAGLANAARRWRGSVAAAKNLSDTEQAVVDAATKHIDDVQSDVNQLQKLNAKSTEQVAAAEGRGATATQADTLSPMPGSKPSKPPAPAVQPKQPARRKPKLETDTPGGTPTFDDKPDLQRQIDILEEFGEAERKVARSALEEEFAVGPSGKSAARRSSNPPGSRPESVASQVGKYVHSNPDLLRQAFRDFMRTDEARAAKFFKDFKISWPKGLAPNEGPGRVVIRLPGKDYIPDGIDWQQGIIYELKTLKGKIGGEVQAKKYALWMNREFPLPNKRTWDHKVVTYDENAVKAFLKMIGWLE